MSSLPEKLNYGELRLTEIVRLLAVCQNRSEERLLQTVLYNKVSEEFYDRCAKAVGKLYKGTVDIQARIDDLFQDSFILIFEKVKSFEPNPDWDEKEFGKVFIHWMSKFANNLILNSWKKEKNEKEDFNKYAKYIEADSKPGSIGKFNYKPTYDKEKFNIVWSTMNPMSREILLACADLNMFEENGPKHLPKEFRKYLREKFKVTDPAIRQAKGRAIEALNSCKIE